MELIAAILLAGPLGYFCRTRKKGLGLYLLAWAIVFPIQTVVVHGENPNDNWVSYFLVNVAILAVALGMNALGARLRERRTRSIGDISPSAASHQAQR